jgi:hypothetical protein
VVIGRTGQRSLNVLLIEECKCEAIKQIYYFHYFIFIVVKSVIVASLIIHGEFENRLGELNREKGFHLNLISVL